MNYGADYYVLFGEQWYVVGNGLGAIIFSKHCFKQVPITCLTKCPLEPGKYSVGYQLFSANANTILGTRSSGSSLTSANVDNLP